MDTQQTILQHMIADFAQFTVTSYTRNCTKLGISLPNQAEIVLRNTIIDEFQHWLKIGTIGNIVNRYRAVNNTEGK